MFGISSTELMIIVIFGFLLFGPDKLPQIGRTLGRALRQFRETQEKMTSVVQSEVIDPMTAAAAAPVKPKKSGSSSTSSTAEDDSDLDSVGEPTPRRKETFAERRARLAAEKAEKEAAAAQAEATESGDANGSASIDAASAAGDADDVIVTAPTATADQSVDAVDQPEPAEEEPAVRTTEDLYARRPHKRKAAADAPATDDAADSSSADASAEGGEQ